MLRHVSTNINKKMLNFSYVEFFIMANKKLVLGESKIILRCISDVKKIHAGMHNTNRNIVN